MDVEILIHGVPDGQDYYGTAEERTNAELFYDKSAESVKLVVETKKIGNNTYTYYSYLRYKGMVGYGGRPGSYFGLTLRIDKYYQDVLHMYNMLDMVFKKYVVGTLLSQSGESYKYMVPSFASKKAEIEQLQQGLIQVIQGTCVWSKFVDLDASFIHPVTTVVPCNIADITDGVMLAAIKKYSKVALSPDYKSNLSKEFEKKLQEVEGKSGALVAEKDKKLLEKDGVISSLNSTISSHQAKIDALQKEVKQKDIEISQLKEKSNLSKMIFGIKEPINNLAEYFRVHDPDKEPPIPSYGHKNFLIGIAGCVLSLVVLVLCVVLLVKNPRSDTKPLENEIEELTQKNLQLSKEIESKVAIISDIQSQLASKVEDPHESASTTLPKALKIQGSDDVKIIIEPNVSEVEMDKSYTFSVSGYKGKGVWGVYGFSSPDDKNSPSINVKVINIGNGNKEATISYTPDGGEKTKKSFKIKGNE